MLSTLRGDAQAIARGNVSPEIKKLADVVASLCEECEKIKKEAHDAKRDARDAKKS
jgi:hypothetical protein